MKTLDRPAGILLAVSSGLALFGIAFGLLMMSGEVKRQPDRPEEQLAWAFIISYFCLNFVFGVGAAFSAMWAFWLGLIGNIGVVIVFISTGALLRFLDPPHDVVVRDEGQVFVSLFVVWPFVAIIWCTTRLVLSAKGRLK